MFECWLMLRFSREYFAVSKSSLTFVLFERIRENSTSRECFASYVTVYMCPRSFVLFVRVRETSISREYAATVSVALGLN